MRPADDALPLRHAVALGLLQGPTELLPVSSSAHTTLLPWLAGWTYLELDPRARKSFELALHAGAGLALALELRTPPAGGDGLPDRRRAGLLALSCAPPALAAALWRGTIERRLGGPRSIAVALAAGAVLMALADTLPAGGGQRRSEQAGAGDGLALGLAQALALIPGVSRSGATLTAARSRGFRRADAHSLSWEVALPVILGASLVEACRLVGAGARGAPARTLLAAGGTSFLATALSARALRRGRYRDRPLLPYSIYRCALAAAVAVRRRRAAGV